jgi:putative acetyltransferase
MEIRRFTATDTPNLIELFRDTVHTVCSRDYSPEQLNLWAPQNIDSEKWTLRFTRNYTIIAE